MSYSFQSSVISARRRNGAQIVFLSETDTWTPVIGEAEVIEDEAHGDIRLLEAEIGAAGLVDVRMVQVVALYGTALRLAQSDMASA